MNSKQLGKWLACNIAFQDDHLQHLGSQGLDRADISTILRALVDGNYINPESYDHWDLDKVLKDMNVVCWADRESYARNFADVDDEFNPFHMPSWVEIDWKSSADNLLQDIPVIELGDQFVTFYEG